MSRPEEHSDRHNGHEKAMLAKLVLDRPDWRLG
jgi:hypothetical protein